MRHTPGPWKWREGYGAVMSMGEVQRLIVRPWKQYDETDDRDIADMHLIASAPALYEALKALCDEWEASFEGQETGFDDTALHEIVIMARHALLKAEGRK